MAEPPETPLLPDALVSPDSPDGATIGRRRLIAGAGALAGAAAAAQIVPQGVANAALPAGASKFSILPAAVRLANTREKSKYTFTHFSEGYIRVNVAGRNNIPATATAAVLTVTAVNYSTKANHVTCWPSGEGTPLASNLNLPAGAVNANMVTVKLGNGGNVDVRSLRPAHLIVDVLGYYDPVTGAERDGRFVTLPSPKRVYDSRQTSRPKVADASFTTIDITANVPPDATAVVVNLTAAQSTGRGHFTVMPYDVSGPPSTSSLNVSGPNEVRAGAAVVSVKTIGGKRRIKVYAHRSAAIILDVFGYYTGPQSSLSQTGLFVPVTPQRLIDTRDPGQIGRMWPGWVVEVPLPKSIDGKAGAIACNVTGVASRSAGHLTVSAARQTIPNTSNVNWRTANAVVPNHVISQVTNQYGMQVFNAFGSHVVVDLAGYFTGTPKVPSLPKFTNPPPPAAPPNWILRVPRLGLTSTVMAGNAAYVTDSGHTWHWTGTGYMGQSAHVAVFGHRTEAGGPYRYIDQMVIGDRITVTTGDGREYTYQMVSRHLTDAATNNILNATRANSGTTFSIVACTVGYDSRKSGYPNPWAATSLLYRIVVNFSLVSWREV